MKTAATKIMHLIEDEIIIFPVRRVPQAFRLRIWRAKDCPAVVMVSQTEGGVNPALASCKVANYVYRALLGYLPAGMDYFEVYEGVPYLVTFAGIGHGDRLILDCPSRSEVRPDEIDSLIGTAVEL